MASVTNRDVDVRTAAHITSLGALVDDVVGDLIRAEAGMRPLADSKPAQRMGALLHAAVESSERPATMWATNPLGDTLRRLVPAEGRMPSNISAPTKDGDGLVKLISEELDAAISGATDRTRIGYLRQYMTILADATLDHANDLLSPQSAPSSWSAR